MNKFIIAPTAFSKNINEEVPVLYRVYFGRHKYYLHKSKKLREGLDRFLDDIFRGMRGKSCPEYYNKVVEYCLKYPAVHGVDIEIVLNDEADKLLRKETALYKALKKDENCLNRFDIEPYKPEWMIKTALQKRCEECVKEGVINGKKQKFKFCINCGRLLR